MTAMATSLGIADTPHAPSEDFTNELRRGVAESRDTRTWVRLNAPLEGWACIASRVGSKAESAGMIFCTFRHDDGFEFRCWDREIASYGVRFSERSIESYVAYFPDGDMNNENASAIRGRYASRHINAIEAEKDKHRDEDD